MKKFVAFLIAFCMLFGAACADTLTDAACQLAQEIDALADNDAYLKMMLNSDEIVKVGKSFGQGDRTQPTMMVSVDMGAPISMMMSMMDAELGLDPMIKEAVAGRLNSSILLSFVGSAGTNTLAATSALTAGNFFAHDMEPGTGIFLMFYGESTPVAVSWAAKNGAVSMSAMFMPLPDLAACTTPEMVASWFNSMAMPGVAVTAVE